MSLPAKYAELFATESRDHLAEIEHALTALESAPGARLPVDALFRSVHTLKGMSGMMGYSAVTTLAHAIETRLAALREAEDEPDAEVITLLFDAADALARAIEVEAHGAVTTSVLDVDSLVARLTPRQSVPTDVPGPTRAEGPGVQLEIVLEADTPLPGARAQIIARALASIGEVHDVTPSVEAMEDAAFSGTFQLRLITTEAAESWDAVARSCGYVAQVNRLSYSGISRPRQSVDDVSPTAEPPAGGSPLQRYVRVDLRRLDGLMNLVGELVILRGQLHSLATPHQDAALNDALGRAGRLIQEIQDGVLGSRMVPVWQVFDRFPRMVRDAARALRKDAALTIEGRDIELDRALLERIAEPLVHLLRNAVDHGIEMPEDRVAAGKSAVGKLTISARRERSAVTIEVRDDGRGVDRARVLRVAREKALVHGDAEDLSDEQVLRLISRPGFSTANEVTDLSGRGVGIDAVVNGVRAVGGVVDFASESGRGTRFTLRLPVTLAIIPALIAELGEDHYCLPLTHVSETVQVERGQLCSVRGRPAFVLRDEVLPFYTLRTLLGLESRDVRGCQIVIVEAMERRAAVAVDRLVGQREVVVKSFENVRSGLACFSGATILDDGRAALILDVGGLLQGDPNARLAHT